MMNGRRAVLSSIGIVALVLAPRANAAAQTLTAVLEARLMPTGVTTAPAAVDINADGTRVVVGAPGPAFSSTPGVVTIFVRSGSTWTQEAQFSGSQTFGSDVAISDDGSRMAGCDDTGVTVYARTGTAWTVLASVARSGRGVIALSGDGTRLFVAGTNSGSSSVFVYLVGSPPTLETTLLPTGSGAADIETTTDGSRVAFGLLSNNNAYVFSRVGTTWTSELQVSGGSQLDLTPDGSYLAISASGAAMLVVRQRSGSTWSTRSTFTGTSNTDVAISADASLVGNDASIFHYGGAAAGYSLAATDSASYAGAFDGLAIRYVARGSSFAQVYRLGWSDGTTCSVDDQCLNSHCDDGLCCHTDCGVSHTDCQACSVAAGAAVDGTCSALSAAMAPMVMCRLAAGACDAPETCITGNTTCPADTFVAGTTCRPIAAGSTCDVAETCDGTSAQCPTDSFQTGTTCRVSTGACDVADMCSGASAFCPPDAFMAPGTMCRPPSALCEMPGLCTGSAATCPNPMAQPSTHVCRMSTGACDVAETCDGVTTACPVDALQPSGYVCGTHASTGACDPGMDVCTGMRPDCPPTFSSGIVCRASAGACDVAESCSGTSASCPPDSVEGAGTVCRASSVSCDPAESCDGTSTSCPPDVNTCSPMPDAAVTHDAAIAHDGGADSAASDAAQQARDATANANDATTAPATISGGCGCRAGGSRSPLSYLLALATLHSFVRTLIRTHARRRRSRSASHTTVADVRHGRRPASSEPTERYRR